MKTVLKIAVAAVCALASPAMAEDLTLSLTTRGIGGTLAIAVYRDAEAFRQGERPMRTLTVPRTGTLTLAPISDLPPGRYAVAVFHDTDGDGRLSTWPVGLPKEAYGFSRDARGRFGPPSFEAAAFDLTVAGGRQAIVLR